MPKAKALKILNQAIKNYQDNLVNNDFLIIYFNDLEVLSKVVSFKKHNFLHLTGIKTIFSPNRFYDTLISGKISEKNFEFKEDGTTKLKLDVIEKLHLPFYSASIIGIFNNQLKLKIRCDNGLGNTKIPHLTIGLETSNKTFFPKTLLKEDIRNNSTNLSPTQIIFKKTNLDSKYSIISYKHKKLDLPLFIEKYNSFLIEEGVCSNFLKSPAIL